MSRYITNSTHSKGPSLSPELQVWANLPRKPEMTMLSRDLVLSLYSLSLGSQLDALL